MHLKPSDFYFISYREDPPQTAGVAFQAEISHKVPYSFFFLLYKYSENHIIAYFNFTWDAVIIYVLLVFKLRKSF